MRVLATLPVCTARRNFKNLNHIPLNHEPDLPRAPQEPSDGLMRLRRTVRTSDEALLIKRLLKKAGHGAASATDNNGETLLHVACALGHQNVAALLLRRRDVRVDAQRSTDGSTPLHLAAAAGHLGTVELLLWKGAWANAEEDDGTRPLHLACRAGHAEVAELLLTAMGAATPQPWWHCSCIEGSRKVAHAADAADADGNTALHWACRQGRLHIAGLLLSRGADPCAANRFGHQPVHWAARHGQSAMVQLLLQQGARPDAPNTCGTTALDYARSCGHYRVVAVIDSWVEEQERIAREEQQRAADKAKKRQGWRPAAAEQKYEG